VEFLKVRTPDAWLAAAPRHLPELLIDHANCEKKAASTALSLMYKYVDRTDLLHKMSRLAREELRHFEQVLDLMAACGVSYSHLSASRYARELHGLVQQAEPQRLVDSLILGAVVEARSCERFVGLIEVLPEQLAALYRQLVQSEARHFKDYLTLAQDIAQADIASRVDEFLARDAELITSTDSQFRFHSGVPG
jgi:tRNA-(ms[2]io[6]A)-hydroxylase